MLHQRYIVLVLLDIATYFYVNKNVSSDVHNHGLTGNELGEGALDVYLLQRLACYRVVQLQGGTASKAHPHTSSPRCHLLYGHAFLTAYLQLIL